MTTIIILLTAMILLYFLAIMPRMMKRPNEPVFTEKLIAHRGLHDNNSQAPENSMAAFVLAVEAGYGIEMDIQLTADAVPVVFHDFTLDRACGVHGKVSDFTFEELQKYTLFDSREKIPSFEAVLSMVQGRVPLVVEFKIEWTDTSLCPVTDRLLQSYHGPYCMESFNPLALIWYRKNRKNVMRGQLSDVFGPEHGAKRFLYFALEHLLLNFLTKPDFIAYNHKYYNHLSRQLCRKLFRLPAAAYTLKNQQDLDRREKDFDVFIFDSFTPLR